MHTDTLAVRPGEEPDIANLTDYLRGKLEGIESGIRVEQFPAGHSNLTYLIRAGDKEYVLRRGPLGPVAHKAHDMAREYRVMQAVHPYFAEVPQVLNLCEDPSVLGAPFFVMERRHGLILRDCVPQPLASLPHYQQRVSEALVDCMVRLHAIDVRKNRLHELGKPEGFLERQVQGWTERWRQAKTEDLPQMDRTLDWLMRQLPPSPVPALVHNDYKLDNVMLQLEPELKIEAVLDWEMATVGDPLADVGLTLCYWSWADAPELRGGAISVLTSQPGWYARDQFVQRYAERSGRDMTRIGYYEVLGVAKLAIILQQIYYRFHRGQTRDERFRNFDKRVRGLARLAVSLVEKHG